MCVRYQGVFLSVYDQSKTPKLLQGLQIIESLYLTINDATDPNKKRVYAVKQAQTQLDIYTDELLDWQVHYL